MTTVDRRRSGAPPRCATIAAAAAAATIFASGCAWRPAVDAAGRPGVEQPDPAAGSVAEQIALLGRLQTALVERGDCRDELPSMPEIVLLDTALADHRAHSVPAELAAILQAEIVRARTSEPVYNEIHFAWGFFFGFIGLPPEPTFALLRGWEEFEHSSVIGTSLGLEMNEGVFGYLWDLERGMQGHAEGVAYFRGEGRTLSDANPHERRGGYAE